MANNFMNSINGFMNDVKGFIKNDPYDSDIRQIESELAGLKAQEREIFTEIGRLAVEKYGRDQFGEHSDNLQITQDNITAAEAKLQAAIAAKAEAERAAAEAAQTPVCPSCGYRNAPNAAFCTECGAGLAAPAKIFCVECGTEANPGARFCGKCGSKL